MSECQYNPASYKQINVEKQYLNFILGVSLYPIQLNWPYASSGEVPLLIMYIYINAMFVHMFLYEISNDILVLCWIMVICDNEYTSDYRKICV